MPSHVRRTFAHTHTSTRNARTGSVLRVLHQQDMLQFMFLRYLPWRVCHSSSERPHQHANKYTDDDTHRDSDTFDNPDGDINPNGNTNEDSHPYVNYYFH